MRTMQKITKIFFSFHEMNWPFISHDQYNPYIFEKQVNINTVNTETRTTLPEKLLDNTN